MTVVIDWTINEILRNVPEAAAVFNRLGIDTCCGGNLTLAQAADSIGLSIDEVLHQLRAAAGDA